MGRYVSTQADNVAVCGARVMHDNLKGRRDSVILEAVPVDVSAGEVNLDPSNM